MPKIVSIFLRGVLLLIAACYVHFITGSVTRLGDLLDKLLKPLATINLPKSSSFLGSFCKGVKINHFSCENIFSQFF